MSAFDDEFGLFGDDLPGAEEDERRSTLGARIIAEGSEIVIDEIEPEDDDRGARGRGAHGVQRGRNFPPRRAERDEQRRPGLAPEIARDRATGLLEFLAKGLVGNPEAIAVTARDDQRQGLILELEVAAEDLGKVIGRAGRVAQALRTVVRAGVEGRVAIEIIDVPADGAAGGDVAMTVEASAEEEAAVVADQHARKQSRGRRRGGFREDARDAQEAPSPEPDNVAVDVEMRDEAIAEHDAAGPIDDAMNDPSSDGDSTPAKRPRGRRPKPAGEAPKRGRGGRAAKSADAAAPSDVPSIAPLPDVAAPVTGAPRARTSRKRASDPTE